jgi:hypothetical protein
MTKTKEKNTFGEYDFPDWVPEHTRQIIREFWGCFGRTYKDWLNSPSEQGVRETCSHGPGPNGFGIPPNGATAFFFLKVYGTEQYRRVEGRYLHRWNNMGSLISKDGEDHTVSSCDQWVRFYQEGENIIPLHDKELREKIERMKTSTEELALVNSESFLRGHRRNVVIDEVISLLPHNKEE